MQRFVRDFLRTNAYREEKKSSRERNGWGGGVSATMSASRVTILRRQDSLAALSIWYWFQLWESDPG